MTRRELEHAIGLRNITTAELREAERLHAQGHDPSYITGWLKVGRDARGMTKRQALARIGGGT